MDARVFTADQAVATAKEMGTVPSGAGGTADASRGQDVAEQDAGSLDMAAQGEMGGMALDMQATLKCPEPKRPRFDGATRYLAPGGKDPGDCSGGTKALPWGTWGKARACLGPGDTLLLRPGRYTSDTSGMFPGSRQNNLSLDGSAERPIRVAPDPQEKGEVVFFGGFAAGGKGYILEGIRFERDPTYINQKENQSRSIIEVKGSDLGFHRITMQGKVGRDRGCVQEDIDGSCTSQKPSFDCLKILGGDTPGNEYRNISITDSDIGWCSQDCVDVTGAIGLVYRGNRFHDCNVMQIKGGTDDIVIEQNIFHNMWQGLNGAPMSCETYCGGAAQPVMPVKDRFIARDVVIRNNLFVNIGYSSVSTAGWSRALIEHNTFYNTYNTVLYVKGSATEFYDQLAKDYCKTNRCDTCDAGGSNCVRITYDAKNIRFRHNVVHTPNGLAIWNQGGGALVAEHNAYHSPKGSVRFAGEDKSQRLGLNDFPWETQSQEADPKLAAPTLKGPVDPANFRPTKGSPLLGAATGSTVCQDLEGTPRGGRPEIGALEYAP